MKLEDLEAVGVGCPGVLRAGGVVHAAANFPSWLDVSLQQLFTETLGRPVRGLVKCNESSLDHCCGAEGGSDNVG